MALQKQIVPISFGQGLDLKTDPKQIVQGKLLRLQNGTFQTPQEIRKRNGYTALTQTILGGTSVAAGIGLEAYKNELDLLDGKYLYGYNSATGSQGWVQRDVYQSAKIELSPVIIDNYTKRGVTGAFNSSGMKAYFYDNSVAAADATSVLDNATGDVLKNAVATFNPSVSPSSGRVVSFGNYFVNLCIDSTLKGKAYSANNFFTTVASLTNMPADTPDHFDAVTIGSNLIIIYSDTSSTSVNAFFVNSSLVGSTPIVLDASAVAASVTVFGDASNRVWFVWDNGTNIKYAIYSSDLTSTVLAATTVGALSVTATNFVGAATATNNAIIVEGSSAAASYNYFLKFWSVNSTGTVTPLQTLYSQQIGGKPFYYNGVFYILTKYVSTLQTTYFLYGFFNNTTLRVVGKFEQGVGGETTNSTRPITDVLNTATGVYEYPVQSKGVLQASAGGVFTNYGIKNAKITLGPAVDSQDIANDLHLTGGQLWMYDSINVVEHGFHLFPENLTNTAGTSGGMTTGSYQYVVVYEWTDAQGQIHQSAPSVPLSVVFGSGSNNSATVTVSTLRVTNKANISNILYRTTVNGSVFYRITSVTTLQITVPTAATNTLTFPEDTAADSAIIGNQQLYTNGGEVENIAVPNALAITTYRNRLIVIPSENPLTWWYSKQVIPGSPVSFSDLFVQNVDQRGGNMTALSVMDDKLIFFKLNQIFFVVGDGPAPNGTGNDYSDAQFISVDTGCSVKESLVLTPMGLMFQSPKGFYLLDRGLNVSYIGAEVEFYNDQTTTSAVLIANTTQVRFTLGNGVSLVYDYLVKQWEVFTNISAVASVNYQNLLTYLTSAGLVLQETANLFTDNGTAIALSLETGWLSFAGLQGFQRIYELIILGEYKSTHTLLVEIYYDFETTVSQSTTITPTSTAPYQWSVMLKRQKCEAIKVRITEADTGTAAEGLSISAMTVEVGVKGGLNRVSSARSFE